MVIIIVTLFRIVIALFGFLVILSTGYELYIKFKKDVNFSQKKLHHEFTVSDNNGVQLNGVTTISTGYLEIKSKIPQELSETTEQETMMNGSTVVLIQHSNQDLSGKKKTQGIISKIHTLVFFFMVLCIGITFHKIFVNGPLCRM